MYAYNQTENHGTISAKLVLVGESGVGKSSIISRYINDTFGTVYPEMGIFLSKLVSISPDLPKISYEIWDTAGQEKYRSITKLYYKDADLILIVYDVSRPSSYDAIKKYWLREVKNNSKPDAMISIVSNKSDLESKVDEDKIKQDAIKSGFIYTKTSAKTSEGINALFELISRKIIKREQDKLRELEEAEMKKNKPKVIKEKKKEKIKVVPLNKEEEIKVVPFHKEEEIKVETFNKEEEKIDIIKAIVQEEDKIIPTAEIINKPKEIEAIDEKEERKVSEKEKEQIEVVLKEKEKEKEGQIVNTQPESTDDKIKLSIKTEEEGKEDLIENKTSLSDSYNVQHGSDSDNYNIDCNVATEKYERSQSLYSLHKQKESEEQKSKCC